MADVMRWLASALCLFFSFDLLISAFVELLLGRAIRFSRVQMVELALGGFE